jgi:hypothetical protein
MSMVIGLLFGIVSAVLAVSLSHPSNGGDAAKIGGISSVIGFTAAYWITEAIISIVKKVRGT